MNEIKVLPTLGAIGGTGWPSTQTYLQEIPRRVQEELGGLNSPNIVFESRNFAQLDAWMHVENWRAIRDLFIELTLDMKEHDHIQALAIFSNTLHKVAEDVSTATGVPVIHIGEHAAKIAWSYSLEKVGFLGTNFTMQEDFILKYFRQENIEVCTPPAEVMDGIDDIIFSELCQDKFEDDSREFLFRQVAEMVIHQNIEGVVLGCTELGLTMTKHHWEDFCRRNAAELTTFSGCDIASLIDLPFIDATECHIDAIVAFFCHYKANA